MLYAMPVCQENSEVLEELDFRTFSGAGSCDLARVADWLYPHTPPTAGFARLAGIQVKLFARNLVCIGDNRKA